MKERAERIAKIVGELTGKRAEANVFYKNNRMMHGIVVSTDCNRMAATVYIDDMEEYLSDFDIASRIADLVLNGNHPEIDVDEISRKEYILENVVACLVGKHGNDNLIKDIIHVPFLDMEIIFRVICSDDWSTSYIVKESMSKQHGIEQKEIYEAALKNMKSKYGVVIESMFDMLFEISELRNDIIPEIEHDDGGIMYVMTNRSKIFGASGILRKDILKRFADQIKKDLYILPSSIHEVIIVPDNGIYEAEELQNMVQDINKTGVSPEEVLTNSVYLFRRATEEIDIAAVAK